MRRRQCTCECFKECSRVTCEGLASRIKLLCDLYCTSTQAQSILGDPILVFLAKTLSESKCIEVYSHHCYIQSIEKVQCMGFSKRVPREILRASLT